MLLPLAVPVHGRSVWIIKQGYLVSDRVVMFVSVDEFLGSILNGTLSISSHSSIRFSPGDHLVTIAVQQAIDIVNIDNLSLAVGYPTVSPEAISKVTCLSPFGLSFLNVKGLQISGLYFEGCGAMSQLELGFNKSTNIVLETNFSSDIRFDRVGIVHSFGIGLLLTNVIGRFSLSNSQLIGNHINCYIEYQHIGTPECFDHTSNTFMPKYVHEVKTSTISLGESCGEAICNSSASGLTLVFNQLHYRIDFHVEGITLLDNAGHGNLLVNTSSCSEVRLINFTNIKSFFSELDTNAQTFGLKYNELQCNCKAPVPRNVSMSQCLFNHSCIHTELHDNLGLAAGVSYTYLNFVHSSISHSNCTSALEMRSIYSVAFDSLEMRDNMGSFSLRVVNRLRLQERVYSITFSGSCSFMHNKGGISIRGDYVRLLKSTHLKFVEKSITTIQGNVVDQIDKQYGAIMYTSDAVLEFLEGSCTMFIDNVGLLSGGITAVRSQLWFTDDPTLLFDNNTGNYGGAVALYEKSEFIFYQSNATIEFINNSAKNYGGGLYVDDSSYLERISNKYVAPYFSLYCCYPSLNFYNNRAQLGGSAMFGGWIDWVNYRYIFLIKHNISQFLHIESRSGDLSPIASRPTRVCWCSSGKPDCSLSASTQKFEIYHGQTIEVMVVATGQRSGTVASTVLAEFDNVPHSSRTGHSLKKPIQRLQPLERIQIVEQNCTKLRYTPVSSNGKERIKLIVSNRQQLRFEDKTINELIKDPKYKLQFTDLVFNITFKHCPIGYHFNESVGLCTCVSLPQSSSYDVYCREQNLQLLRKESTWVGVQESSPTALIIFGLCPFNLCKVNETVVDLTMLEDQCDFNRSGILCGGCQGNLSRAFGTSYCRDCSEARVVPQLIGYGIAGVVLIVFLFVLNLTISVGTINALMFYASIIDVWKGEMASFFPPKFLHSFLYSFISILGMGSGVESCLYDGMTTYAMSWILFAFPCYIWLLSLVIIVVSHHSSRASKWFGRNPVQVLATLFLLSYTKILEITISNSAFAFTTISSVKGHVKYVWRLDGNIPYFSKNHALLFAATMLLLLFICIPYTAILISVQWLQRYSHKRMLRWILKLKPFIDAHTGPYKDKHRYWTGLLLLVRAGIFLLCALNTDGSPLVNCALVTFITLCLICYLLLIHGVYRSRLLNIIEVGFLLNLCILSTSSFFHVIIKTRHHLNFSLYIAYASVGSTFVYTCVVIVYHIAVRINSTRLGKWIRGIVPPVVCCALKHNFKFQRLESSEVNDDLSISQHVTHSSIAIRENDSLLSYSY